MGFVMQIVHSTFTNLVYYFENKYMSGAQRMPLYDIGFDLFPTLTGTWWLFSDLLIYLMLAFIVAFLVLSLFVSLKTEHGRPIYAVFVLKRYLKTLVILQILRIMSFSFTLLPGASKQCVYEPSQEQLDNTDGEYPLSSFVYGSAPEIGDAEEWNPPETWQEIVFRIDPSTGCGDLMFSSHTIFAVLAVMVTWDYFPFPGTKGFITACLILLVPFTLASRKHYTVDVFTSLYVVPIVYELLRLKHSDDDTVGAFESKYGIRFEQDRSDPLSYLVEIRKVSHSIHLDQLPRDFRHRQTFTPPDHKSNIDYEGEENGSYETIGTESEGTLSPERLNTNTLTTRMPSQQDLSTVHLGV
eukprot:CAMPEP_0118662008 /NCGR_PEP_ID=MMETSP0785-20121206/16592_1 /TAXON_ID=91992 /ORGANISM="Bolidomonas pacifica, Strain CCMP 1866" /LENGTH=354 /DNA_ID=CAMNT_0006555503 /DNA_START=168 /DNA_END=1232 /DNA_ORIENTATION=-